MNDKKRRRKNVSPDRVKSKKNKKSLKAKKRDQAISRARRNALKNNVKPYFYAFREKEIIPILFIIAENQQMERLVFEKTDIGEGYRMLHLPIITREMMETYAKRLNAEKKTVAEVVEETAIVEYDEMKALKELIAEKFGIRVGKLEYNSSINLFVARNCFFAYNQKLTILNVKRYDVELWYSDCGNITTIGGYRIYNKVAIKQILQMNTKTNNLCMLQDTAMQILMYRVLRQKQEKNSILFDFKLFGKAGNYASLIDFFS